MPNEFFTYDEYGAQLNELQRSQTSDRARLAFLERHLVVAAPSSYTYIDVASVEEIRKYLINYDSSLLKFVQKNGKTVLQIETKNNMSSEQVEAEIADLKSRIVARQRAINDLHTRRDYKKKRLSELLELPDVKEYIEVNKPSYTY